MQRVLKLSTHLVYGKFSVGRKRADNSLLYGQIQLEHLIVASCLSFLTSYLGLVSAVCSRSLPCTCQPWWSPNHKVLRGSNKGIVTLEQRCLQKVRTRGEYADDFVLGEGRPTGTGELFRHKLC